MFVSLVDETKKTQHVAVVTRLTRGGRHCDLFVFYPTLGTTKFVYDVPFKEHAYFDSEKSVYPHPYIVGEVQGKVLEPATEDEVASWSK